MKKHHEVDFMDGKIVHSVNRCIVYNNKHIEVARFKQLDRKLNLYEFNKKITRSLPFLQTGDELYYIFHLTRDGTKLCKYWF